MKIIKKILIILFFGIIFFLNFLSAYTLTVSNSASSNFSSSDSCKTGQDLLVQVTPFGCSPSIVRTDLLEENDVSVYCQLGATKVNSLIEVNSIDSISFSGKYSPIISGVSFHPAQSALGGTTNLNSKVLSNIGYVVITLKQQANSSAIPDYVTGNLTAKISYDIKNAYGIGDALFYLPEFATESEWEERKYQYSFWSSKGYLKADDITNTGATISVYTDSGKVSSVALKTGQTSNLLYLPNFECQAGLKLKLTSLENPDTRAELRINSEGVSVAKGEKFLNNKCEVKSLSTNGLFQQVSIKCTEDSGANTFSLTISPKITLNIDGEDRDCEAGEKLYEKDNTGVYLGYIGTTGDAKNPKDLIVYLVSIPDSQRKTNGNLTDSEISSITSMVGDMKNAGVKATGIIDQLSDALKGTTGTLTRVSKAVANGQTLNIIKYGDSATKFVDSTVSLVGFAGVQDIDIPSSVQEYYQNAMADYDSILKSYAYESYSEGTTTYGEEALYNEIVLTSEASQSKTASDLCTKFKSTYSNSEKDIDTYCNSYQLSNSESSIGYVTISNIVKKISFDGIYEPPYEDYGAKIIASTPDGSIPLLLTKNSVQYLSSTSGSSVQLTSLDENSTTVLVNIVTSSGTTSKTVKLMKDTATEIVPGYSLTLSEIKLNKIAKVSVTSNINNAGTEANFSFKLGIEKRAVNLSTDQIKERIISLTDSIDQWSNISEGLGTAVSVLKGACLATGVALVAKNFISGTTGTSTARSMVMKGTNGWYSKCKEMVAKGTYTSNDSCLLANADKIDSEVSSITEILQEQSTKESSLKTASSSLSNLGTSVSSSDGKGTITIASILTVLTSDGYSNGLFSSSQLEEISLYSSILQDSSISDDSSVKSTAKSELYSLLSNIQTNSASYTKLQQVTTELGGTINDVQSLESTTKTTSYISYTGLTNSDLKIKITETGVVETTPVQMVTLNGNNYVVALEKSLDGTTYAIKTISTTSTTQSNTAATTSKTSASGTANVIAGYTIQESSGTATSTTSHLAIYSYANSALTLVTDSAIIQQFKSVSIRKASYKNAYKNAELTYYETEPYVGMPAIVPFDLTNGWYASIKQTVSTTATNSKDESGKVTSFYICNVGTNGLEEERAGDDDCAMINTGVATTQIFGFSTAESSTLINKAKQAIEQAQEAYTSGISGTVSILGNKINVGNAAADISESQCTDFMSPNDCLLLFNLCDPVICPSSRCDFGGTYTVKNVAQSGILGSILLCLPNIQEGIVMPVCLTGIKAGIDAFVSVEQSYKDCLQESLDSGETIGICDELHSIYICDFFWNQVSSFSSLTISKVIEFLTGGSKGGGEYIGLSNAWSDTEKAVDYFVNSYGVNAVESFAARSTEEVIGDEVCKVYTSATLSSGADVLSTLLAADSPPQFMGNFQEISLTTATNPATSQYKVYYHIYAGKDSGVSYKVYLKGSTSETSESVSVASGTITVGGYASETKDMIATSGYTQLCISVDDDEECGFKEVSTNFAITYLTDTYVSSEAEDSDITTEAGCITDYDLGIVRICATSNPGTGIDASIGTENARWKEVGYCDTTSMKCWIDSESVSDAITSLTVENETLSNLTKVPTGAMSGADFTANITLIEGTKDASDRVSIINTIINKAYYTYQKARLLLLRGTAYQELFNTLKPKTVATADEGTSTGTSTGTSEGTSSATASTLTTSTIGLAIWQVAKDYYDAKWDEYNILSDGKKEYDNVCTRFVDRCMVKAGVTTSGIADVVNLNSNNYWGDIQNMDNLIPIFEKNTQDWIEVDFKINEMQKGDIAMMGYVYKEKNGNIKDEKTMHIVIFDSYPSSDKKSMKAYGEPGIRCRGTLVGLECTGAASPLIAVNPVNLYTYSIYSESRAVGDWYVHRVFRYIGDLSDSAKAAAEASAIVSEEEDTSLVASEATTTMSEKIYTVASGFASDSYDEYRIDERGTENYSDVSGKFVAEVLAKTGVTSITATSNEGVTDLISDLDESTDFSEVDLTKLQVGDVVILGFGCELNYLAGIVSSVPDTAQKVSYYTDSGALSKVEIQSTTSISSIASAGVHVYKAYRYTNGLSDSEISSIAPTTETWTLTKALAKVETLSGSYTANKVFVDQLIFDEVLTEEDCENVRGTSSIFGVVGGSLLQKDMAWLKKLLLAKKVTGTDSSSPTSSSDSIIISGVDYTEDVAKYNNYKTYFEKYAKNNLPNPPHVSITLNEFKALLVAIAHQNSWGSNTRGGSDWLMGYETGSTNYQGIDKQISTISSVIESVLNEENIGTTSPYASCLSSTADSLETKLHCILSVIKTGKADSVVGNSAGKTYADEVITLWKYWKNYFTPSTTTSSSSTTTSSAYSGNLTKYNNFKTYFETYSKSNLPSVAITISNGESYSWTQNDFKALLVSMAQQGNWGASFTVGDIDGRNWLMGYQIGTTDYQGAEKQISSVSLLLKQILNKEINSTSPYYNCLSASVLTASYSSIELMKSYRLKCILSIYYSGKDYSVTNSVGKTYADGVLTSWEYWKEYFDAYS